MSGLRTGAAHNALGSGAAFYTVGLGVCLVLIQLSWVCKVHFLEIVFPPALCLGGFKRPHFMNCRVFQAPFPMAVGTFR